MPEPLPKRGLRVALITRSLEMGGAQHHVVRLCQALSPAEVELSLYLLCRDEPNDLLPELPSHIPVHISPYPRHDLRVLGWLARGLRRQRAQVAHSFLWIPDAYAALSSRLFGWGPLVISERGDRASLAYGRARQWYDRLVTFRRAARACALSQYGERVLIEHGMAAHKTEFIYNGIDLDQIDRIPVQPPPPELNWPAGAPVIGTVSRLEPYKGADVFVRGLALLNAETPVYGMVIGDGSERARLESLARELNVAHRLAFLGTRLDALGFVKHWDIALLCSRREALSNSILEYMACRKPVVASRVGGIPELVCDGETGCLFEPGDAAGMARAVRDLLNQPETARTMGQRGRARIERQFRLESVARRFLELWQRVAANGRH